MSRRRDWLARWWPPARELPWRVEGGMDEQVAANLRDRWDKNAATAGHDRPPPTLNPTHPRSGTARSQT